MPARSVSRHWQTRGVAPEPDGLVVKADTQEHRLVYRVRSSEDAQVLEVLSYRYHY